MPEEAVLDSVEETVEDPVVEDKSEETTETKTEDKSENKEEEIKEDEEPKDFSPHERPSVKELRTAYPDIFKKFPSLRDIYFREKEYSTLFPTIGSAKEAADDIDAYRELQADILEGTGEGLVTSIAKTSEKALDRFAGSILDSIYKASPDAHWKAISPILETATKALAAEGKKRGNENMINSAHYLSDFLFGTPDIAKGASLTKEEKVDEEKIRKEERYKVVSERVTDFENDIYGSTYNQFHELISDALKEEKDLTSFVKKSMIKSIMDDVGEQLASDRNHMANMNLLWKQAKSNGMTATDKARLTNAYLARAKQVFPGIRNRYLSEARGTNASVDNKTKSPAVGGPGRVSNGVNIKANQVDWSKTSDLDFLNGKITLRK